MNSEAEEIKRKAIAEYVKKWMNGHEPDTFIKNQHGNYIYSAGPTSLDLTSFFEELLEDYTEEYASMKETCAYMAVDEGGTGMMYFYAPEPIFTIHKETAEHLKSKGYKIHPLYKNT